MTARRRTGLTAFGVFHLFIIAAAVAAMLGEVVDISESFNHSSRLVVITASGVKFVALRMYGAAFCGVIASIELLEFEGVRRFLCCENEWSVSVNWSRFWWLRGLVYSFVGLFCTEMGGDCECDDAVPQSAATDFVIYSGYGLTFAGLAYLVVSAACCEHFKQLHLRRQRAERAAQG